jgi:small subunit ribosomal protein S1
MVVKTPFCLYNARTLASEKAVLMENHEQTIGSGQSAGGNAGGDEAHPMDAFLEGEAYDLETPRRGEVRTGTIARISNGDILVDIGAKSEGLIPAREVEGLSDEERKALQVGAEVTVYIVRSGGGGDVSTVLSLVRAEEENDWRQAETLLESQEVYESTVAGYNKGGLIIKLGRLRGFVPSSQVSLSRRRRAEGDSPDKRWGKMVGEPIATKVIEVDRRRNRLILSERAATREARKALKERLINELQPGEIRQGHVISLADFGAFVDIGGADGLVHLSEISWKRVSNPRDVLSVGQEVRVKVLGIDPERKRISLSIRELEEDPWESIVGRLREGQLVEGTITKVTKFGAFARLAGTNDYEIEGLIHISELSEARIEEPRDIVQEGQSMPLRIIKIEGDRRRIGLSLKRVDSAEYAEQDWQAAAEIEPEKLPEGEIEDFDAALDEEPDADDEAQAGEAEDAAQALSAEAAPAAEQPEAEAPEAVPQPVELQQPGPAPESEGGGEVEPS